MSDTPTRYPLSWPKDRPRKAPHMRQHGIYKSDGRPITTAVAMDRLDTEVHRLGGRDAMLSSNIELRLDGRPRSGTAQPADPGVCLYFTLGGKPMVMACDTFSKVEQNIAALAAHIEATRKIARLGVATAEEALQAFAALPPPSTIQLPAGTRPWREVLNFGAGWPERMSKLEARDWVSRRRRALAIEHQGDESKLQELNIAHDAAMEELS